jgi:hypothetical protein
LTCHTKSSSVQISTLSRLTLGVGNVTDQCRLGCGYIALKQCIRPPRSCLHTLLGYMLHVHLSEALSTFAMTGFLLPYVRASGRTRRYKTSSVLLFIFSSSCSPQLVLVLDSEWPFPFTLVFANRLIKSQPLSFAPNVESFSLRLDDSTPSLPN